MPISKYLATLCVGACFVSTAFADVTTTIQVEPPMTQTPMPTFRVEDLETRRSPSGLNVAIFGGATVDQATEGDMDVNPTFGGGIPSFPYDTKSKVGGVGGIKIGYTWDPELNANYVDEGGVKLMPAIEAEAFYLGYSPDGNVNVSGALVPAGTSARAQSDMDSAIFSINGLMKFEIGHFRPYIGFGVGGAYLSASNASLTIDTVGTLNGGNANDFVFAAQAIGGLEVTLTNNWALFAEYKFLYLHEPSFDYGGATPYEENYDYIGHQIVSAGLRYYFY